MSFELAKLDQARQLLADCNTIQEAKHFHDLAEAARHWAKVQGLSLESANYATEIKIRAERRMGQILKETPRNQVKLNGRDSFGSTRVVRPERDELTLLDMGITYNQSSRFQAIASIPKEIFETQIAETKAHQEELTTRYLLAVAKQEVARQRTPEPAITPELPQGKYRCLVIDPPWPVKKIEREERPNQGIELDYPTMSLEEIEALPIPDLADESGCHLYLWVTQKYLPAGLELVERWDFNYQCLMTWRKNVGFTPYSWMYDTEHVIFARRGNLPLQQLGLRLSFDAPVNGHSVKPDVFFDERVVLASPEPRLEMFARRSREGFTVYGNEV